MFGLFYIYTHPFPFFYRTNAETFRIRDKGRSILLPRGISNYQESLQNGSAEVQLLLHPSQEKSNPNFREYFTAVPYICGWPKPLLIYHPSISSSSRDAPIFLLISSIFLSSNSFKFHLLCSKFYLLKNIHVPEVCIKNLLIKHITNLYYVRKNHLHNKPSSRIRKV